MLITKIRTTIIALAAITALSGAAAPLASAQPNQTVSDDTCAQWLTWYQEDLGRANQAVGAGNAQQVTKSYNEAAYDLQLASSAGCTWASVAKAPKTPPHIATAIARVGAARVAN